MTLTTAGAILPPPASPGPTLALSRTVLVRCAAAIAVTGLAILSSSRFTSLEPAALVGLTAVVWLCGWPVHRDAVIRPTSTVVLGSLGTVLPWLWSVHAFLTDRQQTFLSAAAITAALVVTTDALRRTTPGESAAPHWFAGVVVGAGAIACGVWWTSGSERAVTAALAVLAIGAPCTLAVAPSMAHLVLARRGRALGWTLGSGAEIPAAASVDVVLLDKDQTVTTGSLVVIDVQTIDPDHDRNIRWFAGALEHGSDHPIGRAIAKLSGPGWLANVKQLPGLGITGSVDKHPVRVGDPGWLGIMATAVVGTPIGVEVDGRALGHLTVWDDIRPEAVHGLQALSALGIDVHVLSADAEADSAHLADRLGIPEVYADQGRADRVDLVSRFQQGGHKVAFVGASGALNDEALGAATAAISTTGAGIVLDDLDVGRLARIIALCRAFVARADFGRRITLLGTLAGCALAAAGLLSPLWASLVATGLCLAAALVGSSLPGAPAAPARAY